MSAVSDDCAAVTLNCDATRASLRVTGALNADTAAVLAAAADEHILARRRYLRLDLSDVTSVDDAAAAVVVELHSRLLAEHGTLILTGVESWLEIVLGAADDTLLMIAPTATEPT